MGGNFAKRVKLFTGLQAVYRCNINPPEVKSKRHRMEVKFKLTDV